MEMERNESYEAWCSEAITVTVVGCSILNVYKYFLKSWILHLPGRKLYKIISSETVLKDPFRVAMILAGFFLPFHYLKSKSNIKIYKHSNTCRLSQICRYSISLFRDNYTILLFSYV